MNLVFFGTSSFGLPSLDALKDSNHKLLAVVTQPDKPSGRKLERRASAVKEWALKKSVPCLDFSRESEEACVQRLAELKADVFIVISFGRLLKKNLLEMPKVVALNVHASLLPRWRGASPMQSAILAGDAETGVGVMRMVEALDAGDVLLEKRLRMEPLESIATLEPKLAVLGASALLNALDLLQKGSALWKSQDANKATVCTKIKKEDGRIVWSETADNLDRRVRAFLNWPGSYTFFGEKRLILKRCRAEAGSGHRSGVVLEAGSSGIRVGTGQGALVLEELQLEGRNALSAGEFLKGFPLKAGDNLH